MNNFRITRIADDYMGMKQLEFYIFSSTHATTVEDWLYLEDLLRFAQDMQTFPQNIEHELKWENGPEDVSRFTYILLRMFVFNRHGHVAFEIKTAQGSTAPNSSSTHFSILIEPASVNAFGRALSAWLQSDEKIFNFSWKDWHTR